MGNTELNSAELKLQVLGQFSSLSGSFKELPKFVLPLLLDLSEFFDSQKHLSSEEELKKIKMKIQAVEMKNDDDEQKHKQKQFFQEEQTPLEMVFEKLLSSHLKGVLQKALLLKIQKKLLKKAGHKQLDLEKEAGLSTSDNISINIEEQSAQTSTFTQKSSTRKIKPFLGLQKNKNSDLYEKIFSPVSNSIAATEKSLLELFSQPIFSSILEKRFQKEKKENQD